ncbi:MAG: hypothetical protein ACEQSD_12040, partial [Flavobacteriales bacterium]
MPSNPMRDHFQRTVAQKQQQAKLDASRPLGGVRPTGRLQSAAAAHIHSAITVSVTERASSNFELRMFN